MYERCPEQQPLDTGGARKDGGVVTFRYGYILHFRQRPVRRDAGSVHTRRRMRKACSLEGVRNHHCHPTDPLEANMRGGWEGWKGADLNVMRVVSLRQ